MKTILLLFVQFTLINTIVFGQFIENKGQITTLNNVQFYWQFNNMTVYFQKDRAIFISSEIEYQDNEESLKMKERGDYSLAKKRSEEHTSELQSRPHLVCRLLLEKKNKQPITSGAESLQALRDFADRRTTCAIRTRTSTSASTLARR